MGKESLAPVEHTDSSTPQPQQAATSPTAGLCPTISSVTMTLFFRSLSTASELPHAHHPAMSFSHHPPQQPKLLNKPRHYPEFLLLMVFQRVPIPIPLVAGGWDSHGSTLQL